MPTAAIAATGIELRVGNGVSPGGFSISGATNATPIVLTAVAHGIVDVSLVTVTGVTGNTAANGTWIAQAVSPTTLRLRGSVGNGTYGGGGTGVVSDTFTKVAELTDLQDSGVVATLVDASSHDGGLWTSRVPTLLSGNAIRLNVNFVPSNSTHDATTGLGHLLLTKAKRNFLVVFPDTAKTTWAFLGGFVASMREAAPVAGILTSVVTLEFSDQAILAAA